MALGSDSASLLMLEIGKELRFFEDVVTTCGLIYMGQVTISLSWSAFKGIREHIWTKLYSQQDLPSVLGKWAVVTGATEEMGKAFAEELARRGINIILLDGNVDKLKSVASELVQEFSIDTHFSSVNLMDGSVTNKEVSDLINGTDIGILVNSFQIVMDSPMPYTSLLNQDIKSLIGANVLSPTLLCRMVLPGMLQRNRGVILNVSAFSALYPTPFITVYSASKAYIDFLSRALKMECHGSNVHIQTVTPGVIKVEDNNTEILTCLLPSMAHFVRNTVDSLLVPYRITGFWLFSFQFWILKQLPEIMVQRIVYEIMSLASRS